MKNITSISLLLVAVILLPAFSAQAEQPIIFKPPKLGAPATTVGGGTRGISGLKKQATKIQLLAPKQVGLSSSASPTLYWYMPKSSPDNVKLTVREDDDKILLEKNLGVVKTAGIQTIHLADYNISLKPEKNYTWSITVEGDPEQGAMDLFASAAIRYTVPVKPLTDPAQMAESGYWYDTVERLTETKSPHLDGLLQQEGIRIKVGE